MATIKSFTSLEQSKKLAEFLPLESADMRIGNYVGKSGKVDGTNIHYYHKGEPFGAPEIFCAWGLAALLDVLPTKLQIVLAINDFQGDRKEKYVIGSVEHDKYDCYADNPIDACYEMILKLHELNLL